MIKNVTVETIINFFNEISSNPEYVTENGFNMTYMNAISFDIENHASFVFKWRFCEKTFDRIKKELLELGHSEYVSGDNIKFQLGEYNIEIEKNSTELEESLKNEHQAIDKVVESLKEHIE